MAAYRTKTAYWETRVVDRGLGLRDRLFVDGKAAGMECLDLLGRDVLPLLRTTPVDQGKAIAALEAMIPTFRKHRAAIEDGQAILDRRVEIQEKAAKDEAESGQRSMLWTA